MTSNSSRTLRVAPFKSIGTTHIIGCLGFHSKHLIENCSSVGPYDKLILIRNVLFYFSCQY